VDAERLVLGSVLLDSDLLGQIAGTLAKEDFSLEKHRRIFGAALQLHAAGSPVDRLTVYSLLKDRSEAESCDGLSYLISLDDGLPQIPNIDAYVRIVQEKATLRKAIYLAQKLMNRCLLEGEPSAEILAEAEAAIGTLAQTNAREAWVTPYGVVQDYPGGMNAFLNPPQGGVGIPTPWPGLTESLAGLHEGELFVVAGRPSMGKSIVGMQMAHHAAKKSYGAAVFSLEMSKESLVQRMVCSIARVDSQRLRCGYTTVEERRRAANAVAEMESLPLWINETRARTVSGMTAALRKLAVKNHVEVVVIDHLQLMAGGAARQREQNRHAELSLILHALKHEAAALKATIILVSQLNRQCEIENRRPQLSDLRETGTIEEDADVVLFVHRPERYAKNHDREDLKAVAEFIVAKQRNGPTGLRNMVFLESLQRFDSRADDFGQETL